MTDYSDLTDYKVNVLVAEKLGYKTETHEKSVFVSARHTGDNVQNVVGIYDPCNNPGDAWPVIVGSEISLACNEKEVGKYTALGGYNNGFSSEYYHNNANPLRAAMICFLIMQDEK
jgi:hypothetical protein